MSDEILWATEEEAHEHFLATTYPYTFCENCNREDQPLFPVYIAPENQTEKWCASCCAYELGESHGFPPTNQAEPVDPLPGFRVIDGKVMYSSEWLSD